MRRADETIRLVPLRLRPLWMAIGWAMVGTIVWLTLTPRPPDIGLDFRYLDKAEHFTAYMLLSGWFCQLYRGRPLRMMAALLFCMGVGLEFLQGASGLRTFDPGDMVANGGGVLAALGIFRHRLERLLLAFERQLRL